MDKFLEWLVSGCKFPWNDDQVKLRYGERVMVDRLKELYLNWKLTTTTSEDPSVKLTTTTTTSEDDFNLKQLLECDSYGYAIFELKEKNKCILHPSELDDNGVYNPYYFLQRRYSGDSFPSEQGLEEYWRVDESGAKYKYVIDWDGENVKEYEDDESAYEVSSSDDNSGGSPASESSSDEEQFDFPVID